MRRPKSALRSLLANLNGAYEAPTDWAPLLQLATDSLTIGSLSHRVLQSAPPEAIPDEVTDLLKDVLGRTKKRNQRLKRQFLELLPALNAIGVQPIVMRGMASLLPNKRDTGRILSDIDLLVPAERREEVIAVLRSLGYQIFQGFHGPPFSVVLGRSRDVGMVDLHTDIQPYVLEVDYHRLAPLCRKSSLSAGELLLPSPTCALLLLILHDQLHDADYWRGLIDVRHLVETPGFVNSGVDWETLESFFPLGAARNAMHVHLRTAKTLLGVDIPEEQCGEGWARLQLNRRLIQLRAPVLMRLLTFLTALIDPPLKPAKTHKPRRSVAKRLEFKVGRALRPVNAGKV
jgi:hypothetical protein